MRKVTPHIDVVEMLDALCAERRDKQAACDELKSQILSGGLGLVDVAAPQDPGDTTAAALRVIDAYAAEDRVNPYEAHRAREIGAMRLLFETTFNIQDGGLRPVINDWLHRIATDSPSGARSKAGRKAKWDWGPAEDALRTKLDALGDFVEADQIDDWNCQANAERFLAERVSVDGVEPAESTVREKTVKVSWPTGVPKRPEIDYRPLSAFVGRQMRP